MMSRDSDLTTLSCRYGLITFPREDSVIGRSLLTYGEWAQSEVDLLLELVPEGGTAVDAGAFVGTHTLALAQRVGRHGRVVAIEGQPSIRALLRRNVDQNRLEQVEVVSAAVGRQRGVLLFPDLDLSKETNFGHVAALDEATSLDTDQALVRVDALPLDDLVNGSVDLIKADLEGMEVPVLESAAHIIKTSRPHLYLECSSVSNGLRILDFLRGYGYRAFLHRAPAFNPDNHFGDQSRIFGLARETNMLGIAEERLPQLADLLARHPELAPVADLDDLAMLLLSTARWGEPEWATLTKEGLIARITRLLENQYRLEQLLSGNRRQQDAGEHEAASAAGDATARTESPDRKGEGGERPLDVEPAATATIASKEVEALLDRVTSLARRNEELEVERQLAAGRWLQADSRATRLELELTRLRAGHDEKLLEVQRELRHREDEASWLRRRLNAVAGHEPETVRVPTTADPKSSPTQTAADVGRLDAAAAKIVTQLFNADYYRKASPEVAGEDDELLQHFLTSRDNQRRDPHPLFDSSFYLDRSPDLQEIDFNPLLHYVLQGAKEGRDPHPLFSTCHYVSQVPEAAEGEANPLLHYLTEGYRHGFDPHPLFSSPFYLQQAPACRAQRTEPLTHYVTVGAWEGLDPHPLFDSSYYLSHHPDLAATGTDPLSHFLMEGAATGSDPHPFFSSAHYLNNAPGLDPQAVNPLMHFVAQGRLEGRMPRRIFELGHHKFLITELDRLRHDGRPVTLFVTGRVEVAPERDLRRQAEARRSEQVSLHLRPADATLLGEQVKGLLALSPLVEDGPGLLFDPYTQLSTLAAVVRGLGVVRLHLQDVQEVAGLVHELLTALSLPFEIRFRGLRQLLPVAGGPPSDGVSSDSPSHRSAIRRIGSLLHRTLRSTTDLPEWLSEHPLLVQQAERVVVPSDEAADWLRREFRHVRSITVAPPTTVVTEPFGQGDGVAAETPS